MTMDELREMIAAPAANGVLPVGKRRRRGAGYEEV